MITSMLSIGNISNRLDVSSSNVLLNPASNIHPLLPANPYEDSDHRNGERLTLKKNQLHGMTRTN